MASAFMGHGNLFVPIGGGSQGPLVQPVQQSILLLGAPFAPALTLVDICAEVSVRGLFAVVADAGLFAAVSLAGLASSVRARSIESDAASRSLGGKVDGGDGDCD